MDCTHNSAACSCSYSHCSRKGKCCECVSYHAGNRELPACFFPEAAEKTYDRSFGHFIKLFNDKKV